MLQADGIDAASVAVDAIAKDALDISKAISNRLQSYDEQDGEPSNQELLGLLDQQSKLILKYQKSLDQTNARLMSQQKLLLQIADAVEVRSASMCSTCLDVGSLDAGPLHCYLTDEMRGG